MKLFGSRTMGHGPRTGGRDFFKCQKAALYSVFSSYMGKGLQNRVNKGHFRLFAFARNKFTLALI